LRPIRSGTGLSCRRKGFRPEPRRLAGT